MAVQLAASIALARSGLVQVSLPPSDPPAMRESKARETGVQRVLTDDQAQGWFGAAAEDLRQAGGERTWAVIQTSGTTGKPKNIAITHEGERIRAEKLAPFVAHLPGERAANLSGLQFWLGLSRALRALSDGATIVAFPDGFMSGQAHAWLERERIAYFSCTPNHLHDLLAATPASAKPLPVLRVLRCSSAALPESILQDARRRLTPNVYLNYATNEAGCVAVATPQLLAREPGTVGAVLPGIELQIVDAEGRPLPAGTVGQVRLRGPGVRTERPDGWHYPGDNAFLDSEGLLFLKGRSDEVMNFDGMLVAPEEIEAALLRHPAVADAAAFALPSRRHQDSPVAAVVLCADVTMAELHDHCGAHLGPRSPSFIVRVSAVPRNAMGKPLRSEVREAVIDSLRGKVTRS
jgi:acyl-coenzyme A synthetase/AMP-(fatty) acid ligase